MIEHRLVLGATLQDSFVHLYAEGVVDRIFVIIRTISNDIANVKNRTRRARIFRNRKWYLIKLLNIELVPKFSLCHENVITKVLSYVHGLFYFII